MNADKTETISLYSICAGLRSSAAHAPGRWFALVATVLLCVFAGQIVLGCDCFHNSMVPGHGDCGCVACACCGFCLAAPASTDARYLTNPESLSTDRQGRPFDEIALSIDHPPRS